MCKSCTIFHVRKSRSRMALAIKVAKPFWPLSFVSIIVHEFSSCCDVCVVFLTFHSPCQRLPHLPCLREPIVTSDISVSVFRQLFAVFYIRGTPFASTQVVTILIAKNGCMTNWAGPFLSFVWHVLLPMALLVRQHTRRPGPGPWLERRLAGYDLYFPRCGRCILRNASRVSTSVELCLPRSVLLPLPVSMFDSKL